MNGLTSNYLICGPSYSTIRFDPYISSSEDVQQSLLRDHIILGDSDNTKALTCGTLGIHPLINDVVIISHDHQNNDSSKIDEKSAVSKLKEIIVDKKCGISVLRGSHIYLPGILSASTGIYKNCPVDVYVDIERNCLKGSKNFSGAKFFIGKGIVLYTRKEIFSSFNGISKGIGVKMTHPLTVSLNLNNSTLPKSCFAQNFPSVVAGHVLSPTPGSLVLDMCAAPGGKTTHLCSIMNHKGLVVALEKSKSRADKLRENVELLDCTDMVKILVVDSRNVVNKSNEITSNMSPPFNKETFPFILLDAPCSGLGQRPRFINDVKSEKELQSFPPIQQQLFRTAVELLAPGGSLVYCTCTTTVEENEKIVEWALNKFSDILELCEQKPHLARAGRGGCSNLSGDQLSKLQYFAMPNERSQNKAKSHPIDFDTIGFFIAKFRKKIS